MKQVKQCTCPGCGKVIQWAEKEADLVICENCMDYIIDFEYERSYKIHANIEIDEGKICPACNQFGSDSDTTWKDSGDGEEICSWCVDAKYEEKCNASEIYRDNSELIASKRR